MLRDQFTTVYQSTCLINVGVSPDKASFVWTVVDGFDTVVERDLCLPDNIVAPAFTVLDLLSIIPHVVQFQRLDFSLKVVIDDLVSVSYVNSPTNMVFSLFPVTGTSLLQVLFETCMILMPSSFMPRRTFDSMEFELY